MSSISIATITRNFIKRKAACFCAATTGAANPASSHCNFPFSSTAKSPRRASNPMAIPRNASSGICSWDVTPTAPATRGSSSAAATPTGPNIISRSGADCAPCPATPGCIRAGFSPPRNASAAISFCKTRSTRRWVGNASPKRFRPGFALGGRQWRLATRPAVRAAQGLPAFATRDLILALLPGRLVGGSIGEARVDVAGDFNGSGHAPFLVGVVLAEGSVGVNEEPLQGEMAEADDGVQAKRRSRRRRRNPGPSPGIMTADSAPHPLPTPVCAG